ncbi:MAG: DUF3142 domain-containing protein [Gallionellaceae bacterium]|nr:DUF3142 domain-containing protein [Gallionellaceae bacterium]
MKYIFAAILAAASLGFAKPVAAASVNAADYDAFWLWAGVTPQPVLARARSLYILQGQVGFSPRDPAARGHLIAQGGATPRLREGNIWIVYRAHTLNWSPRIYTQILDHLKRWRASGVPVVGIQLDFDARTRHLDDYQTFLRGFRQQLPEDCKLSITGLLDWSSHGDSGALNGLGGVVDEVVLQTYQGRKTIPNYTAYLDSLARLTIPFKIGLVQNGEWSPPPTLADNPNFRGYVVFLLNAQGRRGRL